MFFFGMLNKRMISEVKIFKRIKQSYGIEVVVRGIGEIVNNTWI